MASVVLPSLPFKPFVKRGTVNAVHHADGSIELSAGNLKWKTSPRTLRLCYLETGAQGVYQTKARRVLAVQLEQDTMYLSQGGKSRTALKNEFLLTWDRDCVDCWALDEEVFRLRYEEAPPESSDPAAEAKALEVMSMPPAAAAAAAAAAAPAPAPAAGALAYGVVSLQGKRDENEDTHVILPAWHEQQALFAVFDGHGGSEASAYCAKKLPGMLAAEWNPAAPEASFCKAFVALDRKYIGKNNDDGSTALAAVVDSRARRVHVANAGDSRALLVSAEGAATALSRDHKPADAAERKRIEKASFEVTTDTVVLHGKRVKVPRVDGKLALSRAIGDDSFKDLDEDPATWAVTSVPEVRSAEFRAGDVLVLACDGLFDVCDNAWVAQRVAAAGAGAEPGQLAKQLAEEALKRGSDDNVTVLIVRF